MIEINKGYLFGAWVVLMLFVGMITTLLIGIDDKLGALLPIESEMRDANWIMACDDINQAEAPVTYHECNE